MRRLHALSVPPFIHQVAICALLLMFVTNGIAEGVNRDQAHIPATACSGTPVSVYACSELDRRLLCEAADEAFGFFSSFGLSRQQPLDIKLCSETMMVGSGRAIGRYDHNSDEVRLLSFETYRRQINDDPPFGAPVSEDLYRSFGVHEIAHAIADKNFSISQVPRLSQEYIAAVVQVSTMDPELRSSILRHYQLEAFDTTASMSILYFQLNPSAFAIKAYLHFMALDDQGAFLRNLFSGETLLGDDDDWLACESSRNM